MRWKLLIGLCLCPSWLLAAVVGEAIRYQSGDTEMYAYLAYDDSIAGPRPGILVVHEWWGHNEYARKRARMLAEMGYAALAVDMYGEGKTADHPQDAGKFAGAVRNNMPLARARFEAAMQALAAHPSTGDQMAAIGYCFGGGIVLEMARRGLDLAGVVSFHGSLGSGEPAQPGQVKAQVLVLNGAEDPMVSAEQIAGFQAEMKQAGVRYELINYPGAVHAFTNPEADRFGKEFGLPMAYQAEADQQSWQAMQDFLKTLFVQ
ncbi:MAG: dienelactone hydrolase family protein [Chromatiales bacterium]|nr:dienelactone hydrolase family protein [Chromatiales bacterium]